MKKKEKLKSIVNLTPKRSRANPNLDVANLIEIYGFGTSGTLSNPFVSNPEGTAQVSCDCVRTSGDMNTPGCDTFHCDCFSFTTGKNYSLYYTNCLDGKWRLLSKIT
jgi:hypothetical protein